MDALPAKCSHNAQFMCSAAKARRIRNCDSIAGRVQARNAPEKASRRRRAHFAVIRR